MFSRLKRIHLPKNHAAFFSTKAYQRLRVNAIDHDGCFGMRYMTPCLVKSWLAPVIEYLNNLKQLNNYDLDIVTSSSIRQEAILDYFNARQNDNHLAFLVCEALAQESGAWFDPMLMADIAAGWNPGTTIQNMKKKLAEQGWDLAEKQLSAEELDPLIAFEKRGRYIISDDKINILYPKMHRAALMCPTAIIDFNVFDDLQEDVLAALHKFYGSYPQLIPSNVTLNLYYFNSESSHENLGFDLPELLYSVSGCGSVDANYYETVRIMGETALQVEGKKISYKMAQYITPDILHKLGISNGVLQLTKAS